MKYRCACALGSRIATSNLNVIPESTPQMMENMPVITSYELTREAISLDYKKEQILQSFDGDGLILFSKLLLACANKLEMIITFLALLDLIQLYKVAIFQNNLFDDFEIHRLEKN